MNKNRLRGLRAALTIAERAVEANKDDIAFGHPYERYLEANEKRVTLLKLRISVEESK